VSAELLKARRRGLFLGALGILLFFAVLPLPITLSALRDASLRPWATSLVTFPGCLWNTLRLAHLVLPMLVACVGAGIVGGDYAADTWKMVLPRTPRRSSALRARFLAALLLCACGLWLAMALMCAVGVAGSAVLGVPFLSGEPAPSPSDALRIQAYYLLEFTFALTSSMLAAVVMRSLVGGILVGYLFGQHLVRLLTFAPGGWMSPMTNLDMLQARWLPQSQFRPQDVEAALGRAVGWPTSVACVLAFSAGCFLLAAWLFERRDLT
jgi:ABC-type transport system involved in multi-copper enzyme maturation permease subunit